MCHTRTPNCFNQSLLNNPFLNIQGKFAGTLLRSTPAYAVRKTGNILHVFRFNPFCFFWNGCAAMIAVAGNCTHLFNFFRINHVKTPFDYILIFYVGDNPHAYDNISTQIKFKALICYST